MYLRNGTSLITKYPIDLTGYVKLTREFYTRDVLEVAPGLIGKMLVVSIPGDGIHRYMITETEAYRGKDDKACHASRGRSTRTDIMFHTGGKIYVYFIYGMYWMLNFVTAEENDPQAALIRGIEGFNGPGKLSGAIKIDRSFYGEDLTTSERIWVEDTGVSPVIKTSTRIGIDYAGDIWKNKPWRYFI